jgi:hypothetical protein
VAAASTVSVAAADRLNRVERTGVVVPTTVPRIHEL